MSLDMSQEELKELFSYKDGNLYWKVGRQGTLAGSLAGSITTKGYFTIGLSYKLYYAHRLIFLYHHGHLPKEIDHIDGDTLNNRIENLRPATRSQNCSNSRISKNNKSGIKGVYWNKEHKAWVAKITANGKTKWLGSFWDKEVAEQVVRIERVKSHKEFTNHG